jgi:alpha-1,6-mannosyltransferase
MTPAQEQSGLELWHLALVAVGLGVLSLFAARIHTAGGFVAFCVMAVTMAAAAAWAATATGEIDERRAVLIILVAAAAMRLPFLLGEPYLSTDLYRYIWDGRVQGHGINPYRYVPAAPELAALRDSVIYPNINRADYAPTIYPPAAQLLFFLTTRISDSVLAIKICMLAFDALSIACLLGLLRHLGLPGRWVAAYAWHPLVLWEIAGNAHIDAAMTGTMLFSVWLFLTRSPLQAAAVATIAALMKPIALLALPVYWRPWDWRVPALVAATIALFYVPYLSVGWQVFGFASGYAAEEGYKAGGGFWYPDMLQALTGPIPGMGRIYLVAAGLGLAALALRIGFRTDRSARAAMAALGVIVTMFLILLTPHYPWYYLVATPFLALYPRALTLWVLSVGGLQMHDVIPGDVVPDYGRRQFVFHAAVLLAVAWDLYQSRRGTRDGAGASCAGFLWPADKPPITEK